jgi:hypothetical protein
MIILDAGQNSIEHSNNPPSSDKCVAALTNTSILGAPFIEIAVGDLGMGIRHHLMQK